MTETFVIERRYRGPPKSANGGYACGRLARFMEGAAEVRLHLPPPIDTELRVERREGGVAALLDGERLVAEARSVEMAIDAPAPVSFEEASRAAKASHTATEGSIYGTCFVCGVDREDGLRIFPGRVAGRDAVAATWAPDASVAEPGRAVPPELVWAAIDCPGGHAIMTEPDRLVVLGTMAARLVRPVIAGERHVAMGWALGADGRKRFAGSALYSADGELCAIARETWLEVK